MFIKSLAIQYRTSQTGVMDDHSDSKVPQKPPAWLWLKIGLMSFGGPAAHISLIQQEVCERHKLTTYDTYLRGLNFAVLLPGPEAQQLVTYLGWRIGGIAGALKAGLGFVLPGAIIMILVAALLATGAEIPWIKAIFQGVQPVIVALVTVALFRFARHNLKNGFCMLVAVFALVTMNLVNGVFPIIILVAAALGAIVLPDGETGYYVDEDAQQLSSNTKQRTLKTIGAGLGIWLILTGLCIWILPARPYLGLDMVLTTAALSTFGGAYPAVAFVGEQAVGTWNWITQEQMIDGLSLAETIPGPLILYNAYVGTLSAAPHGFSGALLGGVLAVCFTFLPSFTMVLAFAPYVDWFYSISLVRAALTAISAAVIGIIGKLALFLIFAVCLPDGSPDWMNITLTIAAGILILTEKLPPLSLIFASGLFGLFFMR